MAKYAHILVSKTAREICGAAYQEMAKDNAFFKMWPKEKEFVNKQWGKFIRPAREVLTNLMARESTSSEVKEEIYQALLLDRALPPQGDTSIQAPTLLH